VIIVGYAKRATIRCSWDPASCDGAGDREEGVAKRRYRQFVFEGIGLGKRGELSTGRESRGGGRVGEEGSGKGEFPSGNSHYYGSAFSGSALCGLHSTPPLGVIKRTASYLSR